MNNYCGKCGNRTDGRNPCPFCGNATAEQPPAPTWIAQTPPQAPVPPQAPMPPRAPQKAKKEKKKHKLPWMLRFIIAIVIIAGVLFGCWYAFGNMITLYFHSEDVLETLNSGSLELAGTESAYDELPDYVKDMLGDECVEEDYGPITKAVLPYISVKRVKINGFFDESTVTYEITAPDLESWMLGLDKDSFENEDELMALMTRYIESAPLRTEQVEIKYERDGLVSIKWRGNYYTREFANAICGGFNDAYNVLHEQAMEELEEFLSQAKEAD